MDYIWASFSSQLQADVMNCPDVQGAVLAKFVKIQYPDIPASLYLTLPPLLLMPRPGMMAGRDSHGKEKLFRLGMSHFTA